MFSISHSFSLLSFSPFLSLTELSFINSSLFPSAEFVILKFIFLESSLKLTPIILPTNLFSFHLVQISPRFWHFIAFDILPFNYRMCGFALIYSAWNLLLILYMEDIWLLQFWKILNYYLLKYCSPSFWQPWKYASQIFCFGKHSWETPDAVSQDLLKSHTCPGLFPVAGLVRCGY